MDQITLDRIAKAHPRLRKELLQIYNEISAALTDGVSCRFTSIFRLPSEQQEIYAQGRTKPGKIVSNSKPMHSYHNYGLAVDIVLMKDGKAIFDTKVDLDKDGKSDWIEIVNIFKKYGWAWGGDWRFSDPPHFQKTFGYTIAQLIELYNAKNFDKEGYVRI